MKNNKGFTLIELIVVIAVMSIIAGVSSNIVSSVTKQELKDFVNNYDAMLTQCKVETLSGMSEPILELKIENGEYRAILSKKEQKADGSFTRTVVKNQYLGEDYLECSFDLDGSLHTLSGGTTVKISYNRSTGELNQKLNQVSVSDGRTTYYVIFTPETGYHKIER